MKFKLDDEGRGMQQIDKSAPVFTFCFLFQPFIMPIMRMLINAPIKLKAPNENLKRLYTMGIGLIFPIL